MFPASYRTLLAVAYAVSGMTATHVSVTASVGAKAELSLVGVEVVSKSQSSKLPAVAAALLDEITAPTIAPEPPRLRAAEEKVRMTGDVVELLTSSLAVYAVVSAGLVRVAVTLAVAKLTATGG